ncbi:helix-turn-helix domain-containing protein [Phascolarctobacterium succinatutens]|jgi:predicted transcriptional regulator|uniref:helix-turn-helix domain-containing protein n=1 Tax=Phascolarctobacterium succinatutens TaxID=626940 RepID=UPI0026EF7976|nr:hypothetical protein [Phascolarctobacterium succinatutens]
MDNSKAIIKGLIAMRGMSSQALADGLGITVPAVRNKLSRNSWAVDDLIRLSQACGVRLAFVDDNGRAVLTFPAPESDTNDNADGAK